MEKDPDRRIRTLAGTQHGVFTRAQAFDAGFSARVVENRLRTARWSTLARGIYMLPGADRSVAALAKATTLSLPNSVASHETAAQLHGFGRVPSGRVVVTAPRGANHRHPLAVVHEYSGIDASEHETRLGIPVTSPELTLFHLADVLPRPRLERVLDDQLAKRAVDVLDLLALADFWARRGRHRAQVMWPLLASRGPGFVAPESELESAFLALVRRHGLPAPSRQFATPWDRAEGRVDFAYEAERLLIEVDGRRWHTRDAAYEKDRARDRKAQLLGWRVIRYTYLEVTRRGDTVAAEVADFLR